MQSFSKKLWSRYTLYCLCFMALNLIEFLRNTQPGNIWAAAANATGLVMMVVVFSQLPVREFLKPVNYVYTVICAAAVGALYWHWRQHQGEYLFGQLAFAVLNVWWLGLALPCLFRKIFQEKKLTLSIGVLGWTWIGFGVWSIVSASDRWWPIWYLLMFGSFYLLHFSGEDRAAFLEAMIDGTVISFFIIQSYAFLFRPYDSLRYNGAFSNCNMMALYFVIIYCMILFKIHLLHIRNAKLPWKIFYLMGAGALLGFIFLTMGRTACICAAVVTLCYGPLVLRRVWGDTLGRLVARGCLLTVTAVVIFPLVFLAVRWLPTIHPHPIWYEGEWGPGRVHSWDPPDSEKYVELDEFLKCVFGRFYSTFRSLDAMNPTVLHVKAESGQAAAQDPASYPAADPASWRGTFWGIRGAIWKLLLENSNWTGYSDAGGLLVLQKLGFPRWHPHNLWFNFLYFFGYPGGALFTLLSILVIWKAARGAGNIVNNPYAEMPLLLSLVFFLYGMTEFVWWPGQLIFALVFIVMHPQFREVST